MKNNFGTHVARARARNCLHHVYNSIYGCTYPSGRFREKHEKPTLTVVIMTGARRDR